MEGQSSCHDSAFRAAHPTAERRSARKCPARATRSGCPSAASTVATIADPTITAYTGSVTYEGLQDAGVTMHIDQQNYFAFKVGDVQKAQANVDLKGSQAARAAQDSIADLNP